MASSRCRFAKANNKTIIPAPLQEEEEEERKVLNDEHSFSRMMGYAKEESKARKAKLVINKQFQDENKKTQKELNYTFLHKEIKHMKEDPI